jgi:hypothetical protein
MDSQLKQMTNEQLAWLLAAIDLEVEPDATATWGRFEEKVPNQVEQQRYYRLANAIKRLCEPSTETQLNALYSRINLIQEALPHLLNSACTTVHNGRESLACELIALLEKERQLVGIELPMPPMTPPTAAENAILRSQPEVATVTTKVAVVMVNDGVKCVEPFNPEIEDEQAVCNRHVQEQRARFKKRRPDANWADHPIEVGHVHVHIHDLGASMGGQRLLPEVQP